MARASAGILLSGSSDASVTQRWWGTLWDRLPMGRHAIVTDTAAPQICPHAEGDGASPPPCQ